MISLCIFFVKGACKKKKKPKNPKKYTRTISHDLIDAIHLFYQNQFPYWSFENLIWRFNLKNKLMFIQK